MTGTTARLSRRHFLSISAAACASCGLAAPLCASPAAADLPLARWRGRALGAAASMQISGLTAEQAAPIFAAVEDEVLRLERIFSLYRVDSDLVRLNKSGVLRAPAPELLDVLSLSARLNAASGGRFDPTVQPLWQARAEGRQTTAPVGWDLLHVDSAEVRFAKPGMALTLNGIAQGAVSDHIARLLRRHGLHNVLVDMGEVTALGLNRGRSWRVGVSDPAGQVVNRLQLRDRALATSAPMGTRIGPQGDQPHILAADGAVAHHRLVAISAPGAMWADGLSTAACLMPVGQVDQLVAQFPGAKLETLLS